MFMLLGSRAHTVTKVVQGRARKNPMGMNWNWRCQMSSWCPKYVCMYINVFTYSCIYVCYAYLYVCVPVYVYVLMYFC